MTANNETRPRIICIDLMKGILAISIVFLHLLFLQDNDNASLDAPIITKIMFMCLMSFFIISGYFLNEKYTYVENITKRFKQIVMTSTILIVVLPIILYFYLGLVGQPQPFSDYTNNLINFIIGESRFGLNYGDPLTNNFPMMISLGYYFLMTTFSSFLLFYAIVKPVTKNSKRLIATMAVLLIAQAIIKDNLTIYLPYFIQLVPIATAFMLAGAWMKKTDFIYNMEKIGYRDRRFFALAVASLILNAILISIYEPGMALAEMTFGKYGGISIVPYFVSGLLSFFTFLYICTVILKIKTASKYLSIIGKNGLAVLLLHEFIIKILIAPFFIIPPSHSYHLFPSMSLVATIIVSIMTIIICVLISIAGKRMMKTISLKGTMVKT